MPEKNPHANTYHQVQPHDIHFPVPGAHLTVSHQGEEAQTVYVTPNGEEVELSGAADWTVRFEHGIADLDYIDEAIRAARLIDTDDGRVRDLLAAAEKMRAVFGPAGIL